jgi:hypothetical protein
MKAHLAISIIASVLTSSVTFAAGSSSRDKIMKTCKSSGFAVYADRSKGLGSGHDAWADCYCPLAKGYAQPGTAKIRLPTVDLTQAIAQCKQSPKYSDKCQ